jgi:hypothetical protein
MPCAAIYTVDGILDLQIVPPGNDKQYCLAKTKRSRGKLQCGSVISERNREKAWYLLRECMSCSDLDDEAVRCHTKKLCELLIHSRHEEERKLNIEKWNQKIFEFRNDPRNRNACRQPSRPLEKQPGTLWRDPTHHPILPYAIDDPVESEEIEMNSSVLEIRENATVERYRSLEADQSRSVSTNESMEEISTSNTSSHMSHSSRHDLSGNNSTVYSPITLFSCVFGLFMQLGAFCGLQFQIGKSQSSQNSPNGPMVHLKFELAILEKFMPLCVLLLVGIFQVSSMFGLARSYVA